MANNYPVVEIFDSVQGEGSKIGIPATFIRFAGCNLRCSWCDTKNSWEEGSMMAIAEIVALVHHPVVIITGGEPTIHDLVPLVAALRELPKIQLMIETNGIEPVKADFDWVVCSPKLDADYVINCDPDELKYVVDDAFTIDVIPEDYCGKIPIWLQPNAADLDISMAKCYKMVMENEFLRLGLQLHRIYHIQ